MPEFTTSKPIDINVSIAAGSVNILTEERDTVDVLVKQRAKSRSS